MRIDGPQITGSFLIGGIPLPDVGALATTSSLTNLATTGSNTFVGTQTISGSIIPAVTNAYDLGDASHQFRHLYLSSGSLYINGTKVLGSTAQELQITTDIGQSFKILESGADTITLQSADGNITIATSGAGDVILDPGTGNVALKGTITVYTGNKITSSDGNAIQFGNGIAITGSIVSTATPLVSGSSQISYTGIINVPSGIISGSAQLPSGIVSGSAQLNTLGYATTGSNTFNGNLTVTGYIDTQELRTTYISSSILYRSGSTKFGDELSDTHAFTGSMLVSGSLSVNGTTATLGTGTTNYLPKFTGANTIGNSIVQDSGSVLTVGGAINVTNANINLSNAYFLSARNNANTSFISLIGRNTSDRVIIDADGYGTTIGGGGSVIINPTGGNLGLGVTPSAWLSSNRAFQIGYGSVRSFTNSANTYLENNNYVNTSGTDIYLNNGAAGRYRIADDAHIWYQAPSGTAGNGISFTQAMTLGSNSGLSIGTTTAAPSNGLLLAGALSGTSATFSGVITSTKTDGRFLANDSYGTNFGWLAMYGTTQGIQLGFEGTTGGQLVTGAAANSGILVGKVGLAISANNGATNHLNISSTGAATFSSSVTTGGNLKIGTGFQSISNNLLSITDTETVYRGTPDGSGYEHAKIYSGRDASVFSYGSYLAFYTEGKNSGTTDTSTERMRITSDGRVGFNTSAVNRNYVFSNPANRGAEGFEINAQSGIITFLSYNRATNAYLPISLSEGSSNVLVGTATDAGYKLDVNGTMRVSGAATFSSSVTATSFGGNAYPYNSILGAGADASTGTVFAGSTSGYLSSIDVAGGGATNPNTIIFKTASSERMRITSGGNVLVGTTTNSGMLTIGGSDNRKLSIETAYNIRNTVLFKSYIAGTTDTWARIRLESNYADNYQGLWGTITVGYHPYHASMGRFYQYRFFQSPYGTNNSYMKVVTVYEEVFGWDYYQFSSDVQFYNYQNYLYIKIIGRYSVNQLRSVHADLVGGSIAMDNVQLEVDVAAPAGLGLITKNGAAALSA